MLQEFAQYWLFILIALSTLHPHKHQTYIHLPEHEELFLNALYFHFFLDQVGKYEFQKLLLIKIIVIEKQRKQKYIFSMKIKNAI